MDGYDQEAPTPTGTLQKKNDFFKRNLFVEMQIIILLYLKSRKGGLIRKTRKSGFIPD